MAYPDDFNSVLFNNSQASRTWTLEETRCLTDLDQALTLLLRASHRDTDEDKAIEDIISNVRAVKANIEDGR